MDDFVTCLNIRQAEPLRLVVGEDSVKLECHGTEIEMFPESLEQLLSCVEQALPRLTAPTHRKTALGRPVSTWVRCDPATPLHFTILGTALELHWGPAILTFNKAVLPELIRQGREANTELIRRLAASGDHASDSTSRRTRPGSCCAHDISSQSPNCADDESTANQRPGQLDATA